MANPVLEAAREGAQRDESTKQNLAVTATSSVNELNQSIHNADPVRGTVDYSNSVKHVADAMSIVQGQIERYTDSVQQSRRQAVDIVADVNAQTNIIVDATREATQANKTIQLEKDTAQQRVERNTAAVFSAAGGQAELLEESAKQYAASERIDELQADIDKQTKEKFTGIQIIDDVINELRTQDEQILIRKEAVKQTRAERNIGAIAKLTQEARQVNEVSTVTKTDAIILAGQRQLDAASKIKVAQAELNAAATNAEAMGKVLEADARVLEAHMTGYKALADAQTLEIRSKELDIRVQEAKMRMQNFPKEQELLDLQLKEARRKDKVGSATLQNEIEAAQIQVDTNREQLQQIQRTNPGQAKILQAQVEAAETNLEVLRGTWEAQIDRDRAIAAKAVFEHKLAVETPEELAAQVNIGRAKAGLTTPESVGVIAEKLRNPNTSELYAQYMQAGGNIAEPLGNTAADSAAIKSNAAASGANLPVTPASKAQTIINQRFATQVALLSKKNQEPKSEEASKLLYNATARTVMEELNESPIKDSDTAHPFLLPPKATLAENEAVTSTVLWQDTVSKMDVLRLNTHQVQQAAVNLVRQGRLTPEQATIELNTIFQAGVDINAQTAGGWQRNNLTPQTKYILQLPRTQGAFEQLTVRTSTIVFGGLADMLIEGLTPDTVTFDVLDFTATLNVINRDAAILGPIEQAEKTAAATTVSTPSGSGIGASSPVSATITNPFPLSP